MSIITVVCADLGAGNDPKAFGCNICLGQGGLCSPSALSSSSYFQFNVIYKEAV